MTVATYIATVRERVPPQLLQLPVWLTYRLVPGAPGEKAKKIPHYADGAPRQGKLDSPEDRARLVDFETAAAAMNGHSGLGIALGEVPGEELHLCGMDFDNLGPQPERDTRVLEILQTAGSYCEKSPSGTGLHILGIGDVGTTKKDASGLEIYSGGRFFTVTGDAVNRAGLSDLAEAAQRARELFGAAPAAAERSGVNGSDGIRQGGRNSFLSSEAYRLRKQGGTVEQILIVLRAINEARCIPPLADAELVQIANGKAGIAPDCAQAPTIELRHIADIVAERREPQWLRGLHKVLERNVLAVLAGSRNTFKSFIAHHWVMTAAINAESVVILSAEGAGLDRRTDAWMRTHAPAIDLRKLAVIALERAVNLNASATIEALRQAIDARQMTPAIILVDTYSKYAPGLDENDNAEVALYLSVLSGGLRHYYGSTVLLVAHAGHADARRPRGASVLMANPDCEYIVERPDPTAMTATVTRERFKDCAALPPLAYEAQVIDLGRLDSYDDPVTSLVLRDADLPAVIAARKPELHGRAQRQLLAALRAHGTNGAGIWTLADIREIGRKAGLNKGSARSAAEALTFTPYLTATVGGWRLKEAEG